MCFMSPCYQLAKVENNANETKNNHKDDGGGGGVAHPDDGRTTATAVPNKTNTAQSKISSKEEKQRPKEPPLSSELLKFPGHLAKLLTGRAPDSSKPIKKTHKIALYVCAADSQDCCVEKGVLHNFVYPELRSICRGKGYELHIVDLHWKTALEKQQDHEFPELCLGELARQSEIAYVIPIIFLNDSLGTPLLPKTIEKQDFEFALNSAENKELLQKWYKLDSHAQPPCYRLQPIGSHIPGVKEEGENEVALNEWRLEIERILAVMVEVFPAELRDTYLTTVVEQEVHNTVLMSQELAKRSIWVWRASAPQSADDAAEISTGLVEQRRRLEILQDNLKGQLAEKHIIRVQARDPEAEQQKQYAQDLAEKLDAHLQTAVTKIISEDLAKDPLKSCLGVSGELFQELVQQANYCQKAAQCNINREEVLQHVKNYILESSTTPLVLHGPKGCGKSALVAKAFQAIKVWQPEAYKIIRFTGLTPASGTMEQLLLSIVMQCSVLAGCEDWYCPHSVSTYGELLPKLLASASSRNPLIIMIDGIDQVRSFGCQSCEWLPENLPENLKLVLSVDEDSEMFQTIQAKVSDPTKLVKVPQLGKTEAKSILMSAVVQYNHSINKQIQDFVRNSVMECTLPLYIKILSWQTSLWVDKEHTILPKGNVKDQFHALLEELETILGQVRIKKALSLISASKFGLCDSEMLDLLAQDSVYHSEKTYVPWAPACLFWAQLNKYLAPFLEWTRVSGGYCVRRWRDISFQQAVSDRYMDEDSTREAHEKLEHYFSKGVVIADGLSARIVQQPNKDTELYNIRKLVELPYQTFAVSGSIEERFLLDEEWLLDKVCGADVYQTLEDFALEGSGDEAATLRKCLEESSQALAYDGRQLWAQLHLRLSHISLEGQPRLQRLQSMCAAPPIASLMPLGPLEPSDEPQPINLITRLPEMVRFVCTLATEKGEVVIWDVCTGRQIRTLTNVPQPSAIKLIDWRRCVVLCRRELTVFDLDQGQLLKRLKGVMNQKMPYFGLHDEHHLVALSRNRMYINLMNLETGDCVTTFKAGEDRFLDSLLVSKDGRILVCGDETQKPFPLLVWSLTSRKLMYDLRIPHHDFVTSLAAITDEGHYVCSVCKEVDEPSPNFIIVYDLQSGTLFKKWKPGVNTVSIAISSSQDKFVISGHEDSQILVWDLTTGNCRHTLSGHTAPVTMLRLDSTGSFFLSTDSLCRDRSLRLWNLSSGTCIAVFTPDYPFTACELANGGRAVILAIKGQAGILTLHLKSTQEEEESQEQTYGDSEMDGQVVTLNDEDFR
ncbi:NACHT domain- and WD repeat-containing protein 1 isoform X2 [Neocloeon triangulifer]|uniref:NACHT domain- and WD repeat-containing protein 1 isoform X2 n=1 Tax=Neocloeon triangulifer TaxID=2078957 RepID=UPI00286FA81B|nr:NACHT domain- and WD repeat-containing protein 1 isoform X2 [Neocloeon triangulifer]